MCEATAAVQQQLSVLLEPPEDPQVTAYYSQVRLLEQQPVGFTKLHCIELES